MLCNRMNLRFMLQRRPVCLTLPLMSVPLSRGQICFISEFCRVMWEANVSPALLSSLTVMGQQICDPMIPIVTMKWCLNLAGRCCWSLYSAGRDQGEKAVLPVIRPAFSAMPGVVSAANSCNLVRQPHTLLTLSLLLVQPLPCPDLSFIRSAFSPSSPSSLDLPTAPCSRLIA